MKNKKEREKKTRWWQGCTKTVTLVNSWWEYEMVQLLQQTVRRCPTKLNIELPYDSAIPLLDKDSKELKSGSQWDICS
jgi:hypothetical protein